MSTNYYNILNVSETASSDEIKKAYRQLSLIHHPDRNNNTPESVKIFQQINEAYEILGDKTKKNQYDMSRNNPFANMMGNMHQSQHMDGVNTSNINDIFSALFRDSGIFTGNNDGIHNMNPSIRIFQSGVNGAMPVNMGHFVQQHIQKPTPIIQTISINMDMVFSGGSIPINIERWVSNGTIKNAETETIYIPISKGIDEGEVIIIREKGNIVNDTNKGDVKLIVKIVNNTELTRRGLDLIYEKTITLKESLCGFSFDIKYIGEKIYTINNKPGNIIPPNYIKLIPNMGITRDNHTGSLLINFTIKFPESVSNATIDILNTLKL